MNKARIAGVALALIISSSTPSLAQPAGAGIVKVTSGAVFVVRASGIAPVQLGQVVFETDALRTGPDGRVGITFKDDSRVSLGPNSEVKLERFVYAPAEGSLGLVLRFARGVAAYVSGRIAKLAPDSIRLETPAAIVGVRGTTVVIRAGQ